MNTSMTTRSRSGCGCGCGGSSGAAMQVGNVSGSGCSCGGGCATCQGQDFARPRFFAGQLLTEDDLDLLASYVVEKNRLHNRSFFGEGVVCGLLVTCDPCGGGKVTVQSGYALDCCGNDIVVPCPQSLDINALVKRLRSEKNGGVDCGDPCSEQNATTASKSSSISTSAGAGANGATQPPASPSPPPLPPAEYCLYIRYCEQLTDPVGAYATDDPCGTQACEPTRVREGLRFELRCRTCEETAPDNLFSRIGRCVGNLVTLEQTARNVRTSTLYNARLSPALRRFAVAAAAKVSETPAPDTADDTGPRVEALVKKQAEEWSSADVYEAADLAQTLASRIAASPAPKPDAKRTAARGKTLDPSTPLKARLAQLNDAIPKDRIPQLIDDPFDRTVAEATIERSMLWTKPEEAMKTVGPQERELLRAGVVYDARIQSSLAVSLARIKANLIDRISSREFSTDCTLLRDVQEIALPESEASGAVSTGSATLAGNSIGRLRDALIRYLRECICEAINPPCASCDDPAVLLACLRIEGCDVVDICNLERTFVLTSVAIRYWVPFLRAFGDVLERLCCPDTRCEPPRKPVEPTPTPTTAPPTAPQEPQILMSRSYFEDHSALDLATRWVGPTMTLDPNRISSILPAQFAFSPDNARRLVVSTASVLDVASLRQGTPARDLIAPLLGGGGTAPAVVTKPSPVASPPTVAPVSPEISTMRAELDSLNKKMAVTDKKNRDLEARLRKLEV